MITKNKTDFEILLKAFKDQKVIRVQNQHDVVFDRVIPVTMTRDKLVCVQPVSRHIFIFDHVKSIAVVGKLEEGNRNLSEQYKFEQPEVFFLVNNDRERFLCKIVSFSVQEMDVLTKHQLTFADKESVVLAIKDREIKAKIRKQDGDQLHIFYDYFTGVRIARIFDIPLKEGINAGLSQTDIQQAIEKMKTTGNQQKSTIVRAYMTNIPVLVQNLEVLDGMLCKNILDVLQDAVQRIVEFFLTLVEGEEKETINKFLELYHHNNEEVTKMQADINSEVDDLIDLVQAQLDGAQDNAHIDINEDQEKRDKRLSLAGYQRHLEGKHVSQGNLESSLEEFMEHLQFADLIRQMLENVHKTYGLLGRIIIDNIELVRSDENFDFGPFLNQVYDIFVSKEERKVFSYFVNSLQGIDSLDFYTMQPPKILFCSFDHFTTHYFHFMKNILSSTSSFTQRAIGILAKRIDFLLAESARLEVFSSNSLDSMDKVQGILSKKAKEGSLQNEILATMTQQLKYVSRQNIEFRERISPVLDFLQLHKLVQNRTANWLKIFTLFRDALFYTNEDKIKQIFDIKTDSFNPFMTLILNHTPDEEEQARVRDIFSGKITQVNIF